MFEPKSARIPLFALCLVSLASAAFAATAKNAVREAEDKQIAAASLRGPADIPLRDQAILHLPKGEIFVPPKEAAILMRRMGNFPSDDALGLIFPENGGDWFVDASFENPGYIKDNDGKDIDADLVLKSLKDGSVEDNRRRREQGIKELEILGWIEPPHYDPTTHHLVWSIEARELGSKTAAAENTVNYNTYALGRGGYISLNLITNRGAVDKDKIFVRDLLSRLSFVRGKRYEDFNSKTDKIAEYGLAGLIGVVALKKLGLIALAAAFFLKFLKVILVACAGAFMAVKRFFGRGKKSSV